MKTRQKKLDQGKLETNGKPVVNTPAGSAFNKNLGSFLITLMASLLFVSCQPDKEKSTEWSSYGGDQASSKYFALDQIDAANFNRLEVAWTWRSPEEAITKTNPNLKTWAWESTPLLVDGVLYISTSLSQVAAIDAATGKTQ